MKKLIIFIFGVIPLILKSQQNSIFVSTNGSSNFAWHTYATVASNMNAVVTSGSYSNPSWLTDIEWSKITSTPNSLSGYGITDGVSNAGSYSNPTWITSLAWGKISGTPTTLSGYGITDAYPLSGNPSGFLTSADVSNKLNNTLNSGNIFVGNGSNIATGVSMSGDATMNNSGSLALNNVNSNTGTFRGAYTVNAKGLITAAGNPSTNNNVARSISNTAGSTNRYTISATQPAFVTYSLSMSFSITALLASSATCYLEYSIDSGTNWTTVAQVTTSFNLGLSLSGANDLSLSGYIVAGALVRLRPATTNASITYINGQEILY